MSENQSEYCENCGTRITSANDAGDDVCFYCHLEVEDDEISAQLARDGFDCPYCGGDARPQPPDDNGNTWVKCSDCGNWSKV